MGFKHVRCVMTQSQSRVFLVSLAIAFVVVACTSNALTTERAQKAVASVCSTRLKPGWTVTVVGVQADPQGNASRADLTFADSSGSVYEGHASFVHYTDGRWVLTKVQITYHDIGSGGAPTSIFEGNVDVK